MGKIMCLQFRTHKIIYRRYAGLFFSLCVDITDNELAYLECIHLFVEILDHFFSNVCELDLVFNFHKVCLFVLSNMYDLECIVIIDVDVYLP
jgi:AP-2 complex subunit sigma-1